MISQSRVILLLPVGVAMKTVLFALFVMAVECHGGEDKIIGGYECPPHSQPWQVYLTYDDGERWCGASMINERWAVSAAHCFVPAPRLALHLGEHHLFKEESTEQRIWAEKVIPHPQYDDVTYDNDFMLIKLMEPAVFNKYVQPIPLATSCSQPNAQCLVSGWGNQINSGVNYASVLQCLNMPVLSKSQCEDAYGQRITDNMFCAGYLEGGKDSCQGDSGGPLVCNGELYGVVSWGFGCAEAGFPGVYAAVCRYNNWVKETIANN
ncbi:trypsin-2-like [Clupea harengus]|uniref:trypsin n=1 Tax=Clupea harengus TaxID=7950 RepID=A0A6P3VIV7_CLUHA|nr:trypsin-2-like [Clupea harengus]